MESQTLWLGLLAIIAAAMLVFLVVRARRGGQQQPPEVTPQAAPAAVASEVVSPFVAPPEGAADDLRQIKGIGPKLESLLHELGVFTFEQIATWSPEQLVLVDSQLGSFTGRPARDQWQSQARLLAAGDVKAYERVHGKLTETSGRPAA